MLPTIIDCGCVVRAHAKIVKVNVEMQQPFIAVHMRQTEVEGDGRWVTALSFNFQLTLFLRCSLSMRQWLISDSKSAARSSMLYQEMQCDSIMWRW